jgi:virulence factor Mce-like protein
MSAPTRHSARISAHPARVGAVTSVVIVALLAGILTGRLPKLLGGGGHTVRAVFASTQQLRRGNPVRIDGLTVGSVDSIHAEPGARSATVTMTVADSAGPLYADASASLRWRTVLGAAFYVALGRGTASTGPLGAHAIPLARTSEQVELEDLTSIDQGAARQGLQTLPGELVRALADPGAPAHAFGTLADVSPSLSAGLEALRGQVPDSDLRAMVSSTAAALQALDTPTEQLRSLIAGAAATLNTTAQRAQDIRTLIALAPGVMSRADTTMGQLVHTLDVTDPVLNRLRAPAGQLAPTIAALRPTAAGADRLLGRAVPLLDALRPALSSLAGTAQHGVPLLAALTPSLQRMADTVLPAMNRVDPETQHTAAEMIGPAFAGLGPGSAGQVDDNGHFMRLPVTGGSGSLYDLPCQIFAGEPDRYMLQCQTLRQALSTYLSYQALGPAPGSAGNATP